MDEGYQPSQPPAGATSAGASYSQENVHELFAWLQRNMREESTKLWEANQGLHDNLVRVETELIELRECFLHAPEKKKPRGSARREQAFA